MQFGAALQCLLQRLVYCNATHGPPLLSKIDLANGYYHIPLAPFTALSLAVVILCDAPSTDPLVAIALTLPMGWAQSPPYFCAFTETVVDITNNPQHPPSAKHPLLMTTQQPNQPQSTTYHPTAIVFHQPEEPPFHTPIYTSMTSWCWPSAHSTYPH